LGDTLLLEGKLIGQNCLLALLQLAAGLMSNMTSLGRHAILVFHFFHQLVLLEVS